MQVDVQAQIQIRQVTKERADFTQLLVQMDYHKPIEKNRIE